MKLLKKILTSKPTAASLHTWNTWLAALYALQGVAVAVLATTRTFSITGSYQAVDSLQTAASGSTVLTPASHHLFDLNLTYVVVAFFAIAAIAHLLMATVYRSRYEADLRLGVNRLRWLEYTLGASVMVVAVAVLAGMLDLGSLILVFVLSMVMGLLGLAMELQNPFKKRGTTNWVSFVIGCIAGLAPWLVIALYLLFTNIFGSGHVPGFVYGIFASILVLFGLFAVNLWLQYRKIGPWSNYLYSERMYLILGFTVKAALAWQVYAGALRP